MRFPAVTDGPPIVMPGAPADWRAKAIRSGWRVTEGSALADEPWDLSGTIVCTSDVELAGLALARGAGLAMEAGASDAVTVLDDARRVGAVEWPPARHDQEGAAADGTRTTGLDAETRELLRLLADGLSIADAARRLHMSLRTAQRRLGLARAAFGVSTTPGAVAAWSSRRGDTG